MPRVLKNLKIGGDVFIFPCLMNNSWEHFNVKKTINFIKTRIVTTLKDSYKQMKKVTKMEGLYRTETWYNIENKYKKTPQKKLWFTRKDNFQFKTQYFVYPGPTKPVIIQYDPKTKQLLLEAYCNQNMQYIFFKKFLPDHVEESKSIPNGSQKIFFHNYGGENQQMYKRISTTKHREVVEIFRENGTLKSKTEKDNNVNNEMIHWYRITESFYDEHNRLHTDPHVKYAYSRTTKNAEGNSLCVYKMRHGQFHCTTGPAIQIVTNGIVRNEYFIRNEQVSENVVMGFGGAIEAWPTVIYTLLEEDPLNLKATNMFDPNVLKIISKLMWVSSEEDGEEYIDFDGDIQNDEIHRLLQRGCIFEGTPGLL